MLLNFSILSHECSSLSLHILFMSLLFVHPSVCLSVFQTIICLSICFKFNHLSICFSSNHLSICFSSNHLSTSFSSNHLSVSFSANRLSVITISPSISICSFVITNPKRIFVHPSICCPSVCLSVLLSAHPSVCLSFHLSVYPSFHPSFIVSVCQSVCLSVLQSVCLSVRLSIHPSIHLSVHLSSLYVCPSVRLSSSSSSHTITTISKPKFPMSFEQSRQSKVIQHRCHRMTVFTIILLHYVSCPTTTIYRQNTIGIAQNTTISMTHAADHISTVETRESL